MGAGDRSVSEYGAVDAEDADAALVPEAGDATVDRGAEDRMDQHGRVRAVALAVIVAQREALLDARDDGTFDAESLDLALGTLDAAQISLELQGEPPEL
jgi:CPA1 family monovalent cation:H+ antiporter